MKQSGKTKRVGVGAVLGILIGLAGQTCGAFTLEEEALYRYYQTHPIETASFDVLAGPGGDPAEPQLPEAARAMLEQGDLALLRDLYRQLGLTLEAQADTLREAAGFFYRTAGNPPLRQLEQTIAQTGPVLCLADNLVNHLLLWLDWYPGDDWQARYGAAYGYLTAARRLNLVYRCQAACGQALAQAVLPAVQREPGDLASLLHRLIAEIQALDPAGGDCRLAMWRGRLYLACDQIAGKRLFGDKALAAMRPAAGWACDPAGQVEVALAAIAVEAALGQTGLEQLAHRCEKLAGDLARRDLEPDIARTARLRCVLLTSKIMQQQLAGRSDYHEACLKETGWLAPLARLAKEEPALAEFCQTVLVARLAESMDAALAGGAAGRAGLLADGWPVAWRYGLADHYFARAPGDYRLAAALYERVGGAETAAGLAPAALYRLGLCYDQVALNGPEPERAAWHEKAAESLCHFAARYPDYRPGRETGLRGDDLAGEAIGRAAALVCGELVGKADALRLRVLETLCGKLDGDGALAGPFSRRPLAVRYRYFYGQSLEQAKRLTDALAVYRVVDSADDCFVPARLGGLRVRYALLAGRSDPGLWADLEKQLVAFIEEVIDQAAAVDGAVLLTQIEGQTGDPAAMVAMLGRVCHKHGGSRPLAGAVLNWADRPRRWLEQRHQQGWRAEDGPLAYDWLAVCDYCVTVCQAGAQEDWLTAARRFRQEAAAWAALAACGSKTPDPVTRIIALVGRELATPAAATQLQAVRQRAILALADGNYELARQCWHQVRQASDPDDAGSAPLWWESRYYGLVCLMGQGQTGEAIHAGGVLLRTQPDDVTPWKDRIMALVAVEPAVQPNTQ